MHILLNLESEKNKPLTGNKLAKFIERDLKETIGNVIQNEHLSVQASAGIGNWANVPWVSIIDHRITTTTQSGVYPAYLFKADSSGIYLSLMHGTTAPQKKFGKLKAESLERSISDVESRI